MSAYFHCPCGRRLRASSVTDGAVDCPECGRTVVMASVPKDRRAIWAAVIAIGVIGVAIGSSFAFRKATPAPVVVSVAPIIATPIIAPKVPQVVPVLAEAEMAPVPRTVEPIAPPVVAVTPPPMPRVGVLQADIDSRFKVGDTFNQEVVFSRKSDFRFVGAEFSQAARYAIRSSILISKVHADGSYVAEQTIGKAIWLDGDADSKPTLIEALEKAKGTKFELTFSRNHEVTELKGLKDPIRVAAGKNAAMGQSLRLWSLLDADAWKELAGLTFFFAETPLKAKMNWNKPVSHDWGPLGSWNGKTVYLAAGKQPKQTNLERIDYRHEIYYKPPAVGADRDLPFRIQKVAFQTILAGGAILYDPATNRTTAAEETFRVRGNIQVSLVGMDAAIEMEEAQGFRLTIEQPATNALVGTPGAKLLLPKK